MFFITILATSYAITATLRQSQLKSQLAVKNQYEDDIKNVNEIAAKLSANSNSTSLAEIAELREEISTLKAELTETKSSINTELTDVKSSISTLNGSISEVQAKQDSIIRKVDTGSNGTVKVKFNIDASQAAHAFTFGIGDLNGDSIAFLLAYQGCTELGGTGTGFFSAEFDSTTLTYTLHATSWAAIWLIGGSYLSSATITVE